MEAAEVPHAVAACVATASALGLRVDDAVVLHDSNRLAVRLRPCDVLARVAPESRGDGARFEVEVARRLADTETPLAQLDPRVEPRVYAHDRFAVTLWTYHEPERRDIRPAEYARALEHLHAGMRHVGSTVEWTPHFMDRVADAQRAVDDASELADADRQLLSDTLRTVPRAIAEHNAPEQLLHGEPHPGNVLVTAQGLLFVDLETCCRGPVEFDIAHAAEGAGPPGDVSHLYSGADPHLVRQCWILMLAMIAAWRFEPGDDLPNGRQLLAQWLGQLRAVRSGQ